MTWRWLLRTGPRNSIICSWDPYIHTLNDKWGLGFDVHTLNDKRGLGFDDTPPKVVKRAPIEASSSVQKSEEGCTKQGFWDDSIWSLLADSITTFSVSIVIDLVTSMSFVVVQSIICQALFPHNLGTRHLHEVSMVPPFYFDDRSTHNYKIIKAYPINQFGGRGKVRTPRVLQALVPKGSYAPS